VGGGRAEQMLGWQSVGITVNRFRFTFHNDEDTRSAYSGQDLQGKQQKINEFIFNIKCYYL